MIEAVIFDIGNVLLKFDFTRALRRIAPRCETSDASVLELIEPHKAAYESGKIDRATFLKRAQQLVSFRGSEAEFISAWQEIFTENTPMSDVVRLFHGRLPLYLLSNTSDLHMDHVLERYPIFQLFTDAVYSHVAKCSKPDRMIYEVAAHQFGVVPKTTLFIDDLLPNIETAEALGFQVFHYNWREHEALLERLGQLGLLAH